MAATSSADEDEKFDLIVATNVLVSYDNFEQAQALANVSAMLRPGGIFLTYYLVPPRSRGRRGW